MAPPPLLGQAKIVIDQATLGPGVAGKARNDGVLTELVTLRNDDNTNVLKHQWVLARPRGSTATLSSPNSATTQFEPDVDGTYLIILFVNEGQGRLQKATSLFAVKSPNGYRYPAQGEAAEANWTSQYTGLPNETGWWEDLIEILRAGTAVVAGVEAVPALANQAENLLAVRTQHPPTHDASAYGQVNLGADGNTADNYSTVLGGRACSATGANASCVGGSANSASGDGSFVGSGSTNTASGLYSVVAGGVLNTATGGGAFVGAGANNSAFDYCVVAGGADNSTGANYDAVLGGANNAASGGYASIGGGFMNTAAGAMSVVAGGQENEATAIGAAVSGGAENQADGDYSAIFGGRACQANGDYSLAAGRGAIANNDYSIAINRGAFAGHDGAVVIKDGTNASLVSTAAQQLTLGFTGGIRVFTAGVSIRLYVASVDSNYRDIVQNNRQTTNGTAQSVTLVTIPAGKQVRVKGSLQGKRVSTDDVRCHYFDGSYYENGGTVTLLGASLLLNQVQADNLGAGYSSSLTISGFDIKLNFTGTAGHTVNWVWDFDITMGGSA